MSRCLQDAAKVRVRTDRGVGYRTVDHDLLFSHVSHLSTFVTLTVFFWLLTIVCVPIVTVLLYKRGQLHTDKYTGLPYLVIMIASRIAAIASAWAVRRDPRTWAGGTGPAPYHVYKNVVSCGLFVVALLINEFTPIGLSGLLLLLLRAPIMWYVGRRWPEIHARPRRPGAGSETSLGE